jgi:hypothetical protein
VPGHRGFARAVFLPGALPGGELNLDVALAADAGVVGDEQRRAAQSDRGAMAT